MTRKGLRAYQNVLDEGNARDGALWNTAWSVPVYVRNGYTDIRAELRPLGG
jgi:hypothetical protein